MSKVTKMPKSQSLGLGYDTMPWCKWQVVPTLCWGRCMQELCVNIQDAQSVDGENLCLPTKSTCIQDFGDGFHWRWHHSSVKVYISISPLSYLPLSYQFVQGAYRLVSWFSYVKAIYPAKLLIGSDVLSRCQSISLFISFDLGMVRAVDASLSACSFPLIWEWSGQ